MRMAFKLRESLPLLRFIEAESWTPVAGAYLYPFPTRFSAVGNAYE